MPLTRIFEIMMYPISEFTTNALHISRSTIFDLNALHEKEEQKSLSKKSLNAFVAAMRKRYLLLLEMDWFLGSLLDASEPF